MKLAVKLPAVVVGAILFTAVASGAVSIVIGRVWGEAAPEKGATLCFTVTGALECKPASL